MDIKTHATLKNNLAAFWSLEDDFSDAHTNGIDATLYNSPTFSAAKINDGLNLVRASQQYAQAPTHAALDGADITIAGWVYLASGSVHRIFRRINTVTGHLLELLYDGSNLRWAANGNGLGHNVYNAMSTGVWHFVVARFKWVSSSEEYISLYIDNVLASGDNFLSAGSSFDITGQPLLFGQAGGGVHFMDGSLDEWGYWTRELTSGERADLWNSGAGIPWDENLGAPRVTGVSVIDSSQIRVDFNELMNHNADLVDPNNYTFTGPSALVAGTITAEDVGGVTQVTIPITNAHSFGDFSVLCENMVDAGDGLPVDPSYNTAAFYLGPTNSILRHPTLSAGLIAYYKLDGNPNDAHVNALNGTAYGTPTWPTSSTYCRLRQALQLNGTSQYVGLGTSALFRPLTGISVGGWFWIDSTGGTALPLLSKYYGTYANWTNRTWLLNFDNPAGNLNAIVYGGPNSGDYILASKTGLSGYRNAWHHYLFTFDLTKVILYIDGVEVARTSGSISDLNSNSVPAEIGHFYHDGSATHTYFKGYVDEVFFCARALTPSEVLALFHSGYPLRYEEVYVDESGLAGGNLVREVENHIFPVSDSYLDVIPEVRPWQYSVDRSLLVGSEGIGLAIDDREWADHLAEDILKANPEQFERYPHPDPKARDQGNALGYGVKGRG